MSYLDPKQLTILNEIYYQCLKCHRFKTAKHFRINIYHLTGLSYRCKECVEATRGWGRKPGYKHLEETKKKIAKAFIGGTLSNEHKKNISLGMLKNDNAKINYDTVVDDLLALYDNEYDNHNARWIMQHQKELESSTSKCDHEILNDQWKEIELYDEELNTGLNGINPESLMIIKEEIK